MITHKTDLHAACLQHDCKMVNFAGWEMPIQFQGLIAEHHAVRTNAGIFDISHMGVVSIEGPNAKKHLQQLVPSDLQRIGSGEALYTVLLNEKAGIIDDLIIYDKGQNENGDNLLIIINASRTAIDIAWIKSHIKKNNISIFHYQRDHILLALQGPNSKTYLTNIIPEININMPKFNHKELTINLHSQSKKSKVFISRTGYTGEEGFEILLPSKDGIYLWKELIRRGVTPCGLGARDTLRLEAAMHLYGHEMNENRTPLEAGLGWLVHLEIPHFFIGKDSLEKQTKEGINKKLIGLKVHGKAIPRQHYKVFSNTDEIGEITSGTWSPTLKEPIALAYISNEYAKIGNEVEVEIRNKRHPATIVKKPFYRKVS